jgi:hypothetical protein
VLAAAVRRRFSSFRWQRGDVLLVDNLKMAHSGMPGFGPRRLRAMICNPLPVPCGPFGPGVWSVPATSLDHASVGERAHRAYR